jgi:hypothetical protein
VAVPYEREPIEVARLGMWIIITRQRASLLGCGKDRDISKEIVNDGDGRPWPSS